MKHFIFFLVGFLLLTYSTSAKIWRVNNTGVGISDFTTLQAAHDGAPAGDTLMLVSSPTTYGGLTATKRVIIIGPGYFLRDNYPDYPTFEGATVSTITFNTGSSGSVLMGVSGSAINISTSDISIIRNYGPSITIGAGNNILIAENRYIFTSCTSTSNNVLVRNNIAASYGTFSSTCQAIHLNNVYFYGGSALTYNGQILNNNIFTGGYITLTNCTFANNIDASGTTSFQFGTDNGNKGGFTSDQVFVGTTGNSTDG